MEILNWNKLIVIPLLLIFYGCGQQTMKDEGLETKSISEAGSSSSNTSSEFNEVVHREIVLLLFVTL